jgi:tetratricopeptide (TPR) repeat protein
MKAITPSPVFYCALLVWCVACGGKKPANDQSVPIKQKSEEAVVDDHFSTNEISPVQKNDNGTTVFLQGLLNELYKAGGDFRRPRPKIRLVQSEENVASYRPRTNVIVLEEKALQACRTFGKDSTAMLAFLIGHELTHYYQRTSGETTNFLAYHQHRNANLDSEINADLQGIFLCHLAGYGRIRPLLPQFIDRIYQTYQLQEKTLANYPKQTERRQHALLVQQRADTLFHVFQAATYLTGFGKYEEAAACFGYLLPVYAGQEVHNNLGVLYALQAMQVGGKHPDLLWYPLELDVFTRLEKARGAPLTDQELKQRNTLLQRALQHLETALAMNPGYEPAQLNAWCVMLLLGKTGEVKSQLQNSKLATNNDRKKLLRAIAQAQSESEQTEAIELFEQLQKSADKQVATLAQYNMAALMGEDIAVSPVACKLADQNGYPDGVRLRDLRQPGGMRLDEGGKTFLQWQEKKHSTLFIINHLGSVSAFQVVPSAAVVVQPDIRVGLAFKSGQKNGAEQLSLPTLSGSFWYMAPCKIMIKTGSKNKIEAWAVNYE